MDTIEHFNPTSTTAMVSTPVGRVLNHDLAHELSIRERLVFACGRYEGIDQRMLDHCAKSYEPIEVSLGDYVLNGREVAVLAIVEAVVRFIPRVVGNPNPLVEGSHAPEHRLLEHSNYTKPPIWRGHQVSPALLPGNHAAIVTWRRKQALEHTRQCRPDLFQNGS